MEERWLLLSVRRTAIVTRTRHDREAALMGWRAMWSVSTVCAAEANALDLLARRRLPRGFTRFKGGGGCSSRAGPQAQGLIEFSKRR
ncbi:hypothetical protein KC357_g67 [Hortaea werneckii]|nr:hypothetical protein KC357_g67 [Hortaea werneckii]